MVNLVVYNMQGKEVITLINAREVGAGNYKAQWDAAAFTPGVYFYRLSSDEFADAKKMLIE